MRINSTAIYLFLLSAGLLPACSKHKDALAPGANYAITGIAYIKTSYNGAFDSVLLRNVPIYIAVDTGTNTDTSNYFYSTLTATDGNFTFYVQSNVVPYRIFTVCNYPSSSSFKPLYYGSMVSVLPYQPNTSYELTASIDTNYENGMIIFTSDTAGNIVPHVSVILYTSQVVAQNDSLYTGNQSFRQITTDSMGKAFVAAIPGNMVFESAKAKIGAADSLFVFDSEIVVSKTGIRYDTLILH
jgi:hypothetical protein